MKKLLSIIILATVFLTSCAWDYSEKTSEVKNKEMEQALASCQKYNAESTVEFNYTTKSFTCITNVAAALAECRAYPYDAGRIACVASVNWIYKKQWQ